MMKNKGFIIYIVLSIGLILAIVHINNLFKSTMTIKKMYAIEIMESTLNNITTLSLSNRKIGVCIESKDEGWMYWGLNSKTVRLCIDATIYVGFDCEDIKFQIDSTKKVIHILNIPDPKVTSVDTKFRFIHQEEGIMNSFTLNEYNTLLDSARQVAIFKATRDNEIFANANSQLVNLFTTIDTLIGSVGWSLNTPYVNIRD